MKYYILVGNDVVNQEFSTVSEADQYARHYHIQGRVITEEELISLQQPEQEERPSIIKRYYKTRERNVSIPSCRPGFAQYNPVTYHAINPRFTPHKAQFKKV